MLPVYCHNAFLFLQCQSLLLCCLSIVTVLFIRVHGVYMFINEVLVYYSNAIY
jgi:hypothetical protein